MAPRRPPAMRSRRVSRPHSRRRGQPHRAAGQLASHPPRRSSHTHKVGGRHARKKSPKPQPRRPPTRRPDATAAHAPPPPPPPPPRGGPCRRFGLPLPTPPLVAATTGTAPRRQRRSRAGLPTATPPVHRGDRGARPLAGRSERRGARRRATPAALVRPCQEALVRRPLSAGPCKEVLVIAAWGCGRGGAAAGPRWTSSPRGWAKGGGGAGVRAQSLGARCQLAAVMSRVLASAASVHDEDGVFVGRRGTRNAPAGARACSTPLFVLGDCIAVFPIFRRSRRCQEG